MKNTFRLKNTILLAVIGSSLFQASCNFDVVSETHTAFSNPVCDVGVDLEKEGLSGVWLFSKTPWPGESGNYTPVRVSMDPSLEAQYGKGTYQIDTGPYLPDGIRDDIFNLTNPDVYNARMQFRSFGAGAVKVCKVKGRTFAFIRTNSQNDRVIWGLAEIVRSGVFGQSSKMLVGKLSARRIQSIVDSNPGKVIHTTSVYSADVDDLSKWNHILDFSDRSLAERVLLDNVDFDEHPDLPRGGRRVANCQEAAAQLRHINLLNLGIKESAPLDCQ